MNERRGPTRSPNLTVGEFSRLTHLPVKTLHHYHQVGVLVPLLVDPVTGYRRYAPEQVPVAHLARRLREVRMPLDEVRAVLSAPDDSARDAGIAAYLDRLQQELTQTAAAVASLRTLLNPAARTGPISYRQIAAQPALALVADLRREQIGPWCAQAYPQLMQALTGPPAGPGGALYGPGWFEDGGGSVTAYVPIQAAPAPVEAGLVPVEAAQARLPAGADPGARHAGTDPGARDRVLPTTIPGAWVAVALHSGPFSELDLTYGALGRHVLDRGIGADGPIRELYLVSPGDTDDENAFSTEVCWPIIGPDQRSSA